VKSNDVANVRDEIYIEKFHNFVEKEIKKEEPKSNSNNNNNNNNKKTITKILRGRKK